MVSTMTEIIPRLWISGEYIASNLNSLLRSKITHVVTLTGYAPFPDQIEYLSFDNIQDSLTTNILNVCLHASDWIFTKLTNLQHSVLVHCGAGVSRSGAVIIAYLILKCGLSYSTAYTRSISRRHQIRPNPNFIFQLKYLDYLFNGDLAEWQSTPHVSITYKMTEFTSAYILFHVNLLQKYSIINFYTSLTTIELPNVCQNINIIPIYNLRFVALVEFIKPVDTINYTLQIGHNESIALFLLYNHLILHGYRTAKDALSELNLTRQEHQLLLTYYETKVPPSEQLLVKLDELFGSNAELVEDFDTYDIPVVVKRKSELLQAIIFRSSNMNCHQLEISSSSSSTRVTPV